MTTMAAFAPSGNLDAAPAAGEVGGDVCAGRAEDGSSDPVAGVGGIVGRLSVSRVRTVIVPASMEGFGKISGAMLVDLSHGSPCSSRLIVSKGHVNSGGGGPGSLIMYPPYSLLIGSAKTFRAAPEQTGVILLTAVDDRVDIRFDTVRSERRSQRHREHKKSVHSRSCPEGSTMRTPHKRESQQ